MRDLGVLSAVGECASRILERRGASSPANTAKRTSRRPVAGANSPVEGLRKGNRLSCLGQDQRADRADVPCCRDVHGGVEAFHSSTERPNVGRGCPVLSYVCLISLVIVPRYARSCPATALSSEEMPVNSRKSCCLPSNLKEGDFFQHYVHSMSFRPILPREFPNCPSFCLTCCLN